MQGNRSHSKHDRPDSAAAWVQQGQTEHIATWWHGTHNGPEAGGDDVDGAEPEADLQGSHAIGEITR